MLIRWNLNDGETGKWVASIYSERCEQASGPNPRETQHFWIGQTIVASVDVTSGVVVTDSGGRAISALQGWGHFHET